MRKKFLAFGLVLMFLGLLFISISQTPVTETKENNEPVASGEKNSTEINATLNVQDEFSLSYSGGSTYVNPKDMDVIIYDPLNKSTTVPYLTAKNGIVANVTGLYRMQLLGLFIDPERPLVLTVMRIHRETVTRYPNSNLLPVGMSISVIGAGISIWGALSARGRRTRGRIRKH